MASMAVHQQDSDMYGSFKMELNGGGSTSSLGELSCTFHPQPFFYDFLPFWCWFMLVNNMKFCYVNCFWHFFAATLPLVVHFIEAQSKQFDCWCLWLIGKFRERSLHTVHRLNGQKRDASMKCIFKYRNYVKNDCKLMAFSCYTSASGLKVHAVMHSVQYMVEEICQVHFSTPENQHWTNLQNFDDIITFLLGQKISDIF